jgi:hypothetical protein
VTAESLQPLAKLPKLREQRLGLAKNVDDSALPILAKIRGVYISGSKMPAEGLARLGR